MGMSKWIQKTGLSYLCSTYSSLSSVLTFLTLGWTYCSILYASVACSEDFSGTHHIYYILIFCVLFHLPHKALSSADKDRVIVMFDPCIWEGLNKGWVNGFNNQYLIWKDGLAFTYLKLWWCCLNFPICSRNYDCGSCKVSREKKWPSRSRHLGKMGHMKFEFN